MENTPTLPPGKTEDCVSFVQFENYVKGRFPDEQRQHVDSCSYCQRMVERFEESLKGITEPEMMIAEIEPESRIWKKLGLAVKRVANLVHAVSSSVSSLLKEHRAVTIGVALSVVMVICSIITWRVYFFEQRPSPELAPPPTVIAGSSEQKQTAENIETRKSEQRASEKTKDSRQTAKPGCPADVSSLAVKIEHVHYAAPASKQEQSKLTEQLFDKGMGYYENEKNYYEAIQCLREVVERDSNNAEAQFYLGMSYLLLEEYDLGIEHLQHAAVAHTGGLKEKAHWYLGNAYLKKNDGLSALHEFETIVELRGEYQGRAKECVAEIKKGMRKI